MSPYKPNATPSHIPTSEIDDVTEKESNFYDTDKFNLIRWKSGKRVDRRLLELLQILRELFIERKEFFKEIFPGIHHEFSELFKNIGSGFSTRDSKKEKTIERSVSFDMVQGSELKLGRFKVVTPDLVFETQPGSGQGGKEGDNKSNLK